MTVLNLNDRHRLAILAAAILDHPDGLASPDDLLELAAGVETLVDLWTRPTDRPFADAAARAAATRDLGRAMTRALLEAAPDTRLGRLRQSIISSLQEV